ncbi:MAG: hypothetical protein ACLRSY_01520 [Acutalibacter sp.]
MDPETGEDLPDEVDGEFCAKGYNIMKGYYKCPKATPPPLIRTAGSTPVIWPAARPRALQITGRIRI